MSTKTIIAAAAAIAAVLAVNPASAGGLRSDVAFNTGMSEKTANQPAAGLPTGRRVGERSPARGAGQ